MYSCAHCFYIHVVFVFILCAHVCSCVSLLIACVTCGCGVYVNLSSLLPVDPGVAEDDQRLCGGMQKLPESGLPPTFPS